MQRSDRGPLSILALAVMMLAMACGGGGPSEDEVAKAEEWAWLTETKQTLDAKRQELVDVQAELRTLAAAGEAEAEEGVEQTAADLQAKVQELTTELGALSEDFGNRLVAYINADPMIEGEQPTERQVEALRMKSGEDIILAQEWIEKGGDYKRAIEIMSTALLYDPDNAELKAALAEAEANRYMTSERFEAASKGMTEDEVRQALGQPNLHNIREYPDRDVVAWFYPTAEDGSAAAVWFQPEKKTGELEVYQVKFEAIKPEELGAEGE